MVGEHTTVPLTRRAPSGSATGAPGPPNGDRRATPAPPPRSRSVPSLMSHVSRAARRPRVAHLAAAALAVAALAAAPALPRAAAAQPAPGAAAAAPVAALPLVPLPREATPLPDFGVGRGIAVVAGADEADRFAAEELASALRERGVPVLRAPTAGAVVVHLLRRDSPEGERALRRAGLRFDTAMVAEGYALVARDARVDVVGATAAGVYYGAMTAAQLVGGAGSGARVRGAALRDWPAMRWRGVHDDVSRGPIPTLAWQKRQIRRLAAYKVNLYSPYLEHAFEYASHPLIAPPGQAMTAAEARELTAFARRHHVEIVPEQQTFGHLHKVLTWERYAPMAEAPRGHAVAAADSGALAFARATFAELDSAFPGRFLHLGGDETFELGRGRSAERVRRERVGPVYVDHVARVAAALRPLGRRMMIWGDLGTNHPELVPTLPRDLIAVPWVYDAQPSYDRWIVPFRAAGLETWVAPGASNWWRLYPNLGIALPNIRGLARDGQRLGATGLLNTTWDDFGEQLFEQTWGAILFGAAAAWQPGESDVDAFLRAYPRQFHGDTLGHVEAAERALMEAGAIAARATRTEMQELAFWIDPWSAEGQRTSAQLLPVAPALRLAAERAIEHVVRARRAGAVREPAALDAIELGARRLDFLGLKFQLADDAVRSYARIVATAGDSAAQARVQWFDLADVSGINGRLQDLRDGYAQLGELHAAAWLRESRPAGLDALRARYDRSTQLWVERIERMNGARAQWGRSRTLPPRESVGMPGER